MKNQTTLEPLNRRPFPAADLALGLAALAIVLAALLSGCATGAGKPPTALETKLFNITTNYTPEVHVVTNTVVNTVTQQVASVTTVTQTVVVAGAPQVQVLTVTNTQTVLVPTNVSTLVTVTNQVPSYDYAKGPLATNIQSGAGAVGGLFGPYGALAAALAGGIFGLWGQLRSSKANATSAVLTQVIETGSELLKTTPQGAALADKWKRWMIHHQAQQGVIEQVTQIVGSAVDNEAARNAAAQLVAMAQQVKAGA